MDHLYRIRQIGTECRTYFKRELYVNYAEKKNNWKSIER